MPVVHPVVGVRAVRLFVTHFLDQPSECRAREVLRIDLAGCVRRLLRFLGFRLNYLIQSVYLQQRIVIPIIRFLGINIKLFAQP